MSERFFSSSPIEEDRARLVGPEAHHLLHVMRGAPGDRVLLFDGSGMEYEAEIVRLGRTEVELAVLSLGVVEREGPVELVLAVSLPKGDRQKWLIEKATELGVSRLVPLVTERSVAQPGAGALERLKRTVIEASKQCGRNRLMQIAESVEWAAWIGQTQADGASGEPTPFRLVAHPGGFPLAELELPDDEVQAVGQPLRAAPPRVAACVGPEGGLTEEEIAQATDRGWRLVGLGPRILRVETAALALASFLLASRQWSGD